MNCNRNKGDLFPPFSSAITLLEQRLVEAGLHFYLFMGLRTFEEQEELYARGRTAPGQVVTNARSGLSWHNYGLAADYVLDGMPDKPGTQWSWQTKVDLNADGHNDWYQLGEIAESVGLEWGGRWKKFPDLPHVQYRGGLTINEAFELHRQGGIKAVWEEIQWVSLPK